MCQLLAYMDSLYNNELCLQMNDRTRSMGNHLYRALCLIFILLLLPFGFLSIYDWLAQGSYEVNNKILVGLASTFWGLYMVRCLVRGRPRSKKKQIREEQT